MPASDATHSKGKVKAKAKARDAQPLNYSDNPNDQSNASSSGLPHADDQFGEDSYSGYSYDTQSQRLRISLRQTWKSYFLTGLLAFFTILLGLGLLILIIADSYAAPAIRRLNLVLEGPESAKIEFLNNSLVMDGPENVWVQSVERRDSGSEPGSGGLEVNATVAIRLGVDTDYIMGFQSPEFGHTWLDRTWMKIVRWASSKLGAVTVHVDQLEISPSNSGAHENSSLITVRPTSPIPLSLCPTLRTRNAAYSPVTITDYCHLPLLHLSFSIYPTDDATTLLGFLETSWKVGLMKVAANVSRVTVVGGAPSELNGRDSDSRPTWNEPPKWWQIRKWRSWIRIFRPEIGTKVELEVPPLKFPNMPPLEPGSDLPSLADLIVLDSFVASTSALPQPAINELSTSNPIFSDHHDFNLNDLQRVLSTHKHEDLHSIDFSRISHDLEMTAPVSRQNIVLLAHASLIHPFGALAPLIDLGTGVPPIPCIVSLPIPPPEDAEDSEGSSFAEENPALTSSQYSTSVPVVKVFTSPSFNQTHIQFPIWGYVLPLPNPLSQANSSSNYNPNLASPSSATTVKDFTRAVSTFIRSYLSYEPSPVFISTPFYPSLEVAAVFPPPREKLELIRDVKLEDMWIKPGGIFKARAHTSANEEVMKIGNCATGMFARDERRELRHVHRPFYSEAVESDIENMDVWSSLALEVLASATVHARVVLPPGFDIDLEVTRLWVDALIFDGDVPDKDEDENEVDVSKMVYNTSDPTLPTPFPLPSPLPPRAFARITPITWLNATSSLTKPEKGAGAEDKDSNENEEDNGAEDGKSIYVTAEAVDVPLQVLPGRKADLSRFVTKVLFSSEPVVAGIRGVVAVAVKIPGLTVQTGLEFLTAADGSRHTLGGNQDSISPTSPKTDSSNSNLDSPKPESDPRIEGSELILTDLPFEGKVPIGGSQVWMS